MRTQKKGVLTKLKFNLNLGEKMKTPKRFQIVLFLTLVCISISMIGIPSAFAVMTNEQIEAVGLEIGATPESIAEAKKIAAQGGTNAEIAAVFATADPNRAAIIAAAIARIAPPAEAAAIAAAVARAVPGAAEAIVEAVTDIFPEQAVEIKDAVKKALPEPVPVTKFVPEPESHAGY
jgi:DNA-binding LytR/AlgR family response regulator